MPAMTCKNTKKYLDWSNRCATYRAFKTNAIFTNELKLNMTRERIEAWYRGWTKYTIENLKTKKIRYVTTRTIDINKDLEKELGCDNDEWVKTYEDGQVYIAFSGGKDSTVLLHIARRMFPDIKAVFVDTGLEYPKQYDYCIGGGEYNEKGIWQPNKNGLGLGHCFDVLNEIYGNDFIIYRMEGEN